MKKRVFAALLGLTLLVWGATAAFAQTNSGSWDVTFTADNRLNSNYTAANLSSKVYEMQPGDSVDLTLHLKNDNPQPANWYMTNTVLRSLEEQSANGASGGAYEYELSYLGPDAVQDVLYTSDAVGGEGNNRRVGLKNATESLEDYFYLDTLQPGQTATVNLRVALDGETQGNTYQNTLASLQLNFAVDPVTSTTRTTTVTTPGEPGRRAPFVNTGDDTDLTPFVLTAGVSGVLLLFLALWGLGERSSQKRRRKASGKAAVRALCLLLAVLVGAGLPLGAGVAHAAEEDTPPDADAAPVVVAPASGDGYSYTVRLFPGAQGSIDPTGICTVIRQRRAATVQPVLNEDGVLILAGLQYGDQIIFSPNAGDSGRAAGVVLDAGSKYYVRGVRVSGQDNSAVGQPSFTVTGDADYVVAYGIQGQTVAYTVNYVDAAGNALAPSVTYHGNVGDMPVVAYQYVEGYRPQAYNLTKTLSADASENVFDFVYTPLPENVITETLVLPAPGVPEVPEPEPEPTPEPEPEPEPGGEELQDEPIPLEPEPPDLENLDPESTPLGDLGESLTEFIEDYAAPLSDMPVAAKGGLAAAIVALGGVLIFLIVAKKRKKKDAETQK